MFDRIKRAGQVLLRGHYDSAKTTNENKNHVAQAMNGDRHPVNVNTKFTRSSLRRFARYEFDNNCYLRGLINNLTLDMIGNTYPKLQSLTNDRAINKLVDECFVEWCEHDKVNWPGKLAQLNNDKLVDGECFMPTFYDSDLERHTGVSLNVNTLAARRVTNHEAPQYCIDNGIYDDDGVLVDVISGRPVRYRISTAIDDLLSGSAGVTEVQVDASKMFQWYTPTRSEQYRGVSEIAAALPLYQYLRRFTLATVSAAELAASFAAIMKSTDPAMEGPAQIEEWAQFPIVRNMLLTLPEGRDITQLKSEHPIPSYQMFVDMILREIGACLNVPFGIVAHDLSKYNFASGRLDIQAYNERLQHQRMQLSIRIMNRVHEYWVLEFALALMMNQCKLAHTPESQAELRDSGVVLYRLIQSNRYRYQWRFYNRPSTNPVDDANAAATNLESQTTTLSDIYGSRGEDWRDKIDQLAEEKKYIAEKLGATSTSESTI